MFRRRMVGIIFADSSSVLGTWSVRCWTLDYGSYVGQSANFSPLDGDNHRIKYMETIQFTLTLEREGE